MLDPAEGQLSPVIESADLHCPHCEYSLRGLTSSNCPECGQPFDRAELMSALTTVRPSNDWDAGPNPLSYFKTAFSAAFEPARFARRLAWVPDRSRARGFSMVCLVLAACEVWLSMILAGGKVEWAMLTAIVFSGSAAAWLCESMVAGLLSLFLRPRGNPHAERYSFWRAMAHYGGGFLVLSGLVPVCYQYWSMELQYLRQFVWLGFAISVLWWMTCICIMVATRSGRAVHGLLAAGVCMVGAAASITGGYFAAFFLTLFLWNVFDVQLH